MSYLSDLRSFQTIINDKISHLKAPTKNNNKPTPKSFNHNSPWPSSQTFPPDQVAEEWTNLRVAGPAHHDSEDVGRMLKTPGYPVSESSSWPSSNSLPLSDCTSWQASSRSDSPADIGSLARQRPSRFNNPNSRTGNESASAWPSSQTFTSGPTTEVTEVRWPASQSLPLYDPTNLSQLVSTRSRLSSTASERPPPPISMDELPYNHPDARKIDKPSTPKNGNTINYLYQPQVSPVHKNANNDSYVPVKSVNAQPSAIEPIGTIPSTQEPPHPIAKPATTVNSATWAADLKVLDTWSSILGSEIQAESVPRNNMTSWRGRNPGVVPVHANGQTLDNTLYHDNAEAQSNAVLPSRQIVMMMNQETPQQPTQRWIQPIVDSNIPPQNPKGERCGHPRYWKRLRAKRGRAYFVCLHCGSKWQTSAHKDN